jgi:hypothetical protein
MACPFAAATLGGILVACKLLLFRDKYRFLTWTGLGIAIGGWTLYALLGRPLALRLALEAENSILIIGMVARVLYLVRYHRQTLEVPRFLAVFLRYLRPFALHPATLALKAVLLGLLVAEAAGLHNIPAGLRWGAAAALAGWVTTLIIWHAHARSVET